VSHKKKIGMDKAKAKRKKTKRMYDEIRSKPPRRKRRKTRKQETKKLEEKVEPTVEPTITADPTVLSQPLSQPKNLCQQCGVDLGRTNPRQLCGKWRCLKE